MSTINLSELLRDISAEQPCGPDLLYDADCIQLAKVMQGTPEVEYGGMRIDAADPDWKSANVLALELLGRTRDLRLAAWLTRALMGLHGFPGLDDGLALIEGFIERYWADVHPLPDPDDASDVTERLNTILSLDDMDGLLRQIRFATLAGSPMHGTVCLRDVDIALGEIKPGPEDEPKSMATIESAFDDMEYADLVGLAEAAERACARVRHIEEVLDGWLGNAGSISIKKLPHTLDRVAAVVRSHLARHPGVTTSSLARCDASDATDEGQVRNAVIDGNGAIGGSGDIRNRDDVAHMIDRVCEYYAMEEPGSPVPMLLHRAKRLINMNFIELMSELSPQGLAEISFLAGLKPEAPQHHSDVDAMEAF